MRIVVALLFSLGLPVLGSALLQIPAGTYKPILGKGQTVQVSSFSIEDSPVRNADFLEFVRLNPKWQKTRALNLFIDKTYLSHWKSDLELGAKAPADAPVVYVSWFAAKAYCESKGLQLPRVDQWEYLAQYGPKGREQDVKKIVLDWYSRPTPETLPAVRSTFQNRYGVWDVHGLIWEWTLDFNTTFVTGESRGDTALEKSMFCGSGSVGAADPSDYAAFMRFGFRSSLKANYTVGNLGFRCVHGGSK